MAAPEQKKKSLLELGSIDDWRKKSGLSCSFLIFAALNLAMIVVGGDGLFLCPIQPMVPIYLIVAGSTSLSLLVVRLLMSHFLVPKLNLQTSDAETGTSPDLQMALKAMKAFDSVASIFSTCWLIVGGYYVYDCYSKVSHEEETNPELFCDYTAYTFAFIVITIGFISLVLSVIAAICACCWKSADQ